MSNAVVLLLLPLVNIYRICMMKVSDSCCGNVSTPQCRVVFCCCLVYVFYLLFLIEKNNDDDDDDNDDDDDKRFDT